MGLIFDFTKWYTCKKKGCYFEIYNDIDLHRDEGWCKECYHDELIRRKNEKWND